MQTRWPLCMTSHSKPDGRVVRVLSSSAMCVILSILRARNVFNAYMKIEMSHMWRNFYGNVARSSCWETPSSRDTFAVEFGNP